MDPRAEGSEVVDAHPVEPEGPPTRRPATWMTSLSAPRRPGPSAARSALSWLSAAGQAARHAAQARCRQVERPGVVDVHTTVDNHPFPTPDEPTQVRVAESADDGLASADHAVPLAEQLVDGSLVDRIRPQVVLRIARWVVLRIGRWIVLRIGRADQGRGRGSMAQRRGWRSARLRARR